MEIAVIILSLAVLVLLLKIIVMKISIRELRKEFSKRSELNSNAKIGISSRDADLRGLTEDMNRTLEKVQKRYLLYSQGDMEVKRTITNVSHDLRTPLTAIIGYLELMKQKKTDGGETDAYLEIIENRALYMKDLTEELFEFSGIMADEEKKEPVMEEIFLNQLLEDCIMDFYGVFSQRGMEPQVEITEKKIIKKLDRRAMERVLANLMNNALKYSKGDLKIVLDEEGVLTFSNYAPELTPVDAGKLFDRYYTVQTGKNSTGLGLAIAKNLVNRMNGTISATVQDGNLLIIIRME